MEDKVNITDKNRLLTESRYFSAEADIFGEGSSAGAYGNDMNTYKWELSSEKGFEKILLFRLVITFLTFNTDKNSVFAYDLYVLPFYPDVFAFAEKRKGATSAEDYDCDNLAGAGVYLNIAYIAEPACIF